jgi:hypothetical protein
MCSNIGCGQSVLVHELSDVSKHGLRLFCDQGLGLRLKSFHFSLDLF